MPERVKRTACVERVTRETSVSVRIDLDGSGEARIDTGIGFFDHMLDAFARHGMFDLEVSVKGDLHVDGHHTVEDTGIVLGQAFAQALGDKRGIVRFGEAHVPMDEALVLGVADISGRGQFHSDVAVPPVMLGSFDATLAREFLIAFATNAGVTLHTRLIADGNTHHVIEAQFKAAGRALDAASALDPRRAGVLPSTKGVL